MNKSNQLSHLSSNKQIDSDISGRIYWITGASSGIGKALCQALDEKGAKIILSSRRIKILNELRASLKHPENHQVVGIDLADNAQFDVTVERAWAIHGKIDVLVNNGGISQRSLALETDQTVDRMIMEVDYFGTIALTKLVAKKMIIQESGTILSISSVAGKIGSPMRSAYSGAKHALIGFMDCLRAEITQFGIRVLVVCPGWIRTEISRNSLTGDMSKFDKMDDEISNGMPVELFVERLINVLKSSKEEVVIAKGKALLAYHVRRFFPNSYHKLIRKLYQKK